MFYKFIRGLSKLLVFFLFRVELIGKENVPVDGGMILAVNHRSNWDVIIATVTCRRKLCFMAKSELFKNKLLSLLISNLGAFPIQRGKGDVGAIKCALKILNSGNAMLMFPEGRRVKSGQVNEAKAGVAMLAIRAEAPVVPVCISGEYGWMKKLVVKYGEPIRFDKYYGQKLSMDEIQSLSNDVLKTVNSLKVGI